MVLDINPGAASAAIQSPVNVNGLLYFVADDGVHGPELWKSDGTAAGTALVKDINPTGGSNPQSLIGINGTLFFTADDGTHGAELWKSDGTTTGTALVRDIRPGDASSAPISLTERNGALYFLAENSGKIVLWTSDGTEQGTTVVRALAPTYYDKYLSKDLVNVNGTLFFAAFEDKTSFELWRSDGSAAGTTLVTDINRGSYAGVPYGSYPDHLVNANGTLYFFAASATTGRELWRSDGTSRGTVLVKDINPGVTFAYPNGSEPAPSSVSMATVNGIFYFTARTNALGTELWKTDGTGDGTALVRDFAVGAPSSNPRNLTSWNGTLFFSVSDGTNGLELWKSDGTDSGTVQVKDISPAGGGQPKYLTPMGGFLFFSATDGKSGVELWQTDGSAQGTVQVQDISPAGSSTPQFLTTMNGTLFFAATNGTQGVELWKYTNAPPLAHDDVAVAVQGVKQSVNVVSNDSDPDGDALQISVVIAPAHGTAVVNDHRTPGNFRDDVIDYTSATGYTGPDSFTYRVSDGLGGVSTATVTLTVDGIPVARPDADGTLQGVRKAIHVLANDSDPENDPLRLSIATAPGHGTAALNNNGTPTDLRDDFIDYTPAAGFHGTDTFIYQVTDPSGGKATATATIRVEGIPVANTDSAATVQGQQVNINVLANDSDPEGDALQLSIASIPVNGWATVNDNGTSGNLADDFIVYRPRFGFSGTDTFVYQVLEASGGRATATVTVSVDGAPTANPDRVVMLPLTHRKVDVLANDSDPDGDLLQLSILTGPAHGTATLNNNGTPADPSDDFIDYAPQAGFLGQDTFVYQVADGRGGKSSAGVTVTVTTLPVAEPDRVLVAPGAHSQVNVLANDGEPAGDPLRLTLLASPAHGAAVVNDNGTPTDFRDDYIDYSAPSGYHGTDTFTYLATNPHGATATGTVTMLVDRLPAAQDDRAATLQGRSITIHALANDLDPDSDPLQLSIALGAAHGTAVIDDNGTPTDFRDDVLQYTPYPAFFGVDTVRYRVDDGFGGTATATVTIITDGLPVAGADAANALPGTTQRIAVLANDSDPDNDPLQLSLVSEPAHGVATLNNNGTPGNPRDDFFEYQSQAGYFGPDSFVYQVADGRGGTAQATVTITVDRAPTAGDDRATTRPGTVHKIDVLANDTDPDDDPLVIDIATAPAHGTAVVRDNGTPANPRDDYVDYTPAAGFHGVDSFVYRINDGRGGVSQATVTITVDTPPAAVDDNVTTLPDTKSAISVLANDTDLDHDALQLSIVTTPGHGTATVNNNGTPADFRDDFIDYVPRAGYIGADSFGYEVSDGFGATARATVNLLVTWLPVAGDDQALVPPGTAKGIAVLTNDSDPNGDPLQISVVSGPARGAAVVNDHGTPDNRTDDTIDYTPQPGFYGTDHFVYQVVNRTGGTATAMVTVRIAGIGLDQDPLDPAKTALVVVGSADADGIVFRPADAAGNVSATLTTGGAVIAKGTFHPTGHIIALGMEGNDKIQVLTGRVGAATVKVKVPAIIDGGDGDDTILLSGGRTKNIVLGGAGNDFLGGSSGVDLLIGGAGADVVRGELGNDIVIGDGTVYDTDFHALCLLMEEWGRADKTPISTRIDHLVQGGGLNGSSVLTGATVLDDSAVDQLFGRGGSDWFLPRFTNPSARDVVKDRTRVERVQDL